MGYNSLKTDRWEEGIGRITLDSPERLNALGVETASELRHALFDLDADPDCRAIVVRGAGRAFSSGGNIKDMEESLGQDPADYMDRLTEEVYATVAAVPEMQKPVMASVHGFAYGAALDLVMACDLALAASDALFCQSFIKLGLIPGGLATVLMPRIMGMKKTRELCLTGREISADEAYKLGIVSRVTAPDELENETLKMARQIAKAPPLAVARTKALLWNCYYITPDQQSVIERRTQVEMAKTKDYAEAVRAFMEKRKPEFKGE